MALLRAVKVALATPGERSLLRRNGSAVGAISPHSERPNAHYGAIGAVRPFLSTLRDVLPGIIEREITEDPEIGRIRNQRISESRNQAGGRWAGRQVALACNDTGWKDGSVLA